MGFYDDASLIFLAGAEAGKDGKAYSIKPTDGDGDFTFSRGSNLAATRVGADGLIEKGRENLLTYSNDFNWSLDDVTITSGQSGYDGTNNAKKVLGNTNSSRHFLRKTFALTPPLAISVYVKASGHNYIQIASATTSGQYINFDLSDGSIGNVGGGDVISDYVEDIGSGWYRIGFVTNRNLNSYYISLVSSKTAVWLESWAMPNATDGVLIQSAQIEKGLAVTPYIESGATTGKAGLLEDEPRFDYSGGATCPSLLLEPSRTNLFTQSEYFGDSSWTKVGSATTTNNYTTSPSGQNNATRLQWTNATNYIYQSVSHIGSNHTLSIYLKSNTGVSQNVKLFMDNGSKGKDVVVTTQWQRFEFTNTTATTQSNRNAGLIKSSSQVGDLDISIFAAQFEQGSYPTSYIPNHSGGSVTRGDELGEIGDYIGSTITFGPTDDFSIFYDGEVFQEDRMILGGGASSLNAGRLWIRGGQIRIDGTTPSVSLMADTNVVVDLNTRFKLLVKRNGATIDFFLDGSKLTTTQEDTDATFVINSLFWSFNNTYTAYGKHNQMLVFDSALSDADCITLTT